MAKIQLGIHIPEVQLGIRIPEELDLAIENAAKQRYLKKKELIIQLLMHGLALISNAKNLNECNETNQASPDSRSSSLIQSHSTVDLEATLLASDSLLVKSVEKRLTDLEMASENLSRQLAEIAKGIELNSAINQPSNGSNNNADQAKGTDIFVPTLVEEDIEQGLTTPATEHTKFSQGVEDHLHSPGQREISINPKIGATQEQDDDLFVRMALLAESLPLLTEQVEEVESNQSQELRLSSTEFVNHGKEALQALQTQIDPWAELIEEPQAPRQRRRRRNRVICVEDG